MPNTDEPARPRTAFVTGATGSVGAALTRELLRRGHTVVALARGLDPEVRVRHALAVAGTDAAVVAGRLRVVAGDLRDDGCDADLWPGLVGAGYIDEVWHCAASFRDGAAGRAEVEATNVGGTQRVLAWASAWHRRRAVHFHHVSTAFASPVRDGLGREELAGEDAPARNAYERSKQLAERRVVAAHAATGLPVTIHRPAIIVGDSATGTLVRPAAYYDMLRALAAAVQRARTRERPPARSVPTVVPLRIAAQPDARLNLVPIDFVTGALLRLGARAPGRGEIFNVVHESPVTIGALFAEACRLLDVTGVQLVAAAEFRARPPSARERLFQRITQFEDPYVRAEVAFCTARFRAALPVAEWPAPALDRALLERLNRAFLAGFAAEETAVELRALSEGSA